MKNNDEQRHIVAYLDGLDLTIVPSPSGEGCLLTKVNAVWDVQSTGGEDLSALMASILDKAIKGEL